MDTTSPIWSRSAQNPNQDDWIIHIDHRPILRKRKKRNGHEWNQRNLQRIVVFPALSRPRTRIRASLLPKTDENIFVNSIPILRDSLSVHEIESRSEGFWFSFRLFSFGSWNGIGIGILRSQSRTLCPKRRGSAWQEWWEFEGCKRDFRERRDCVTVGAQSSSLSLFLRNRIEEKAQIKKKMKRKAEQGKGDLDNIKKKN